MSRDSELQKDICVKATTSNGNSGNTDGKDDSSKRAIALCASCDRCRARKTKCDGKRPCGNCAAKYMKKHKLTSIEGIDVSEFECVYSPAKRRGPVPGRAGQTRKASEAFSNSGNSSGVTRFGGWPPQSTSGGVSTDALQTLG
eukprot:CAMPEP_0201249066 /NCGR_PEP_ID=MMETSP0852-20130820/58480_1 /ASSEMBLY_ACC=CAM_ASM_000632 /TAXON_ID=183588 /ORGANISM="Pseudo-nitzschia fraudulenta, Strain WWA7" /LENGTH=142 /DNA_ID=CAMNT_0047547993 /DNA_START=108 /DNA_END=532 /DNA_ORIENTATION=+